MGTAKTWVQLLAAILAAIAPALVTNDWTNLTYWVNVMILAVGAYQIWNAQNTDIWPAGKTYASASMAVLVLLVAFVDGGVNTGEIIQLVLAALTPFGVYAISNSSGAHRAIAT